MTSIPLSPLLPKDKLIWRCTANGQFSVRSAYHLAVEWQEEESGGPSNPGEGCDMWKVCWQLNVPNAVKVFVWRACHNILPTRANLFKRKKSISEHQDFAQLFEAMIGRYDKHELELFTVVARKVWMRRNTVVHGGDFIPPNQVFLMAEAGLEDFQRVNTQVSGSTSETPPAQTTIWQPPPANMVKVNWDAAIEKKIPVSGLEK
ncbi:uncharacterized protein LOC132173397 [Corylus avellana]|uniref:uncharacterized protein LOC132173397 n=1 Tax=Corylus avellana TaxID=13451 RepID=UPI00286C134D|nr:uncharacterized protein LOC132173397 [Corylus avellana]